MKKLSLLLCSMVFMSAMATQAACPCKTTVPCKPPCEAPAAPVCTTPTVTPPCACPCATPAPCPCATPAPCPCVAPADPCNCKVPTEAVVKEESSCYQLSQCDLFKKLCLDSCQLEKAKCLYSKYLCDTTPLKDRLKCEKEKLCKMVKGCATPCEIKEQKKLIKDIKQDIKDKWECYQNSLKELLTKDQLKEYKKITKEENKKYKQLKKNKCCCKQS